MTAFAKEDVAAACCLYGPLLRGLPAGVDGVRLMWAIAGNESSFGADCTPRHEPAYDIGGRYAAAGPMPGLLRMFGSDAAKSYGPWQVLLCNAIGFKPEEFTILRKCAEAFLGFLNRALMRQRPVTIEEVFDLYNSGNWRDSNVPHEYIARGLRNYDSPMPARSAAAAGGEV